MLFRDTAQVADAYQQHAKDDQENTGLRIQKLRKKLHISFISPVARFWFHCTQVVIMTAKMKFAEQNNL
jgi:hypothetical protein